MSDAILKCFEEMENLFHRHWSNDVSPGYDKRQWQDAHNRFLAVWRETATALGVPRDRPLK